jgi:glycosyltransferase involved in cell wall biosynthesis
MIEALMNDLPVAAFQVTGPIDIVEHGKTGFLGNDLELNIRQCLKLDRKRINRYIKNRWSWRSCIEILHTHLLRSG